MGLLNTLLGFRWSLYIVRNEKEVVYAMLENSVLRIAGYVMGYFKDGSTPIPPWSLYLNFNKKHKSFKILPKHFTPDGDNVTELLLKQIQTIDPGYEVRGAEPVFIDVRAKKRIKIREEIDYSDLQARLDKLSQPKELTFFSIMDEVFSRRRKRS